MRGQRGKLGDCEFSTRCGGSKGEKKDPLNPLVETKPPLRM